jgi:hypothetical protein
MGRNKNDFAHFGRKLGRRQFSQQKNGPHSGIIAAHFDPEEEEKYNNKKAEIGEGNTLGG